MIQIKINKTNTIKYSIMDSFIRGGVQRTHVLYNLLGRIPVDKN
jgi:hypothetical protein